MFSFIWEGGHLESVLAGPAMFIVIGGTLGASMITTSIRTILRIPKYLRIVFSRKEFNHESMIELIVHMAERARRDGILGLENKLGEIQDPFFQESHKISY